MYDRAAFVSARAGLAATLAVFVFFGATLALTNSGSDTSEGPEIQQLGEPGTVPGGRDQRNSQVDSGARVLEELYAQIPEAKLDLVRTPTHARILPSALKW